MISGGAEFRKLQKDQARFFQATTAALAQHGVTHIPDDWEKLTKLFRYMLSIMRSQTKGYPELQEFGLESDDFIIGDEASAVINGVTNILIVEKQMLERVSGARGWGSFLAIKKERCVFPEDAGSTEPWLEAARAAIDWNARNGFSRFGLIVPPADSS